MSAAAAQRFPSRRPPLKRLLAGPAATMARGTPRGAEASTKRCVVTLDAPTFDRIAMLAAVSRVSFSEAVRQLLVAGLDQHQGQS